MDAERRRRRGGKASCSWWCFAPLAAEGFHSCNLRILALVRDMQSPAEHHRRSLFTCHSPGPSWDRWLDARGWPRTCKMHLGHCFREAYSTDGISDAATCDCRNEHTPVRVMHPLKHIIPYHAGGCRGLRCRSEPALRNVLISHSVSCPLARARDVSDRHEKEVSVKEQSKSNDR